MHPNEIISGSIDWSYLIINEKFSLLVTIISRARVSVWHQTHAGQFLTVIIQSKVVIHHYVSWAKS